MNKNPETSVAPAGAQNAQQVLADEATQDMLVGATYALRAIAAGTGDPAATASTALRVIASLDTSAGAQNAEAIRNQAEAASAAAMPNLKAVPSSELQLELALRAGPRFRCMSPECRTYHNAPGKWDTCPSCGRKGYLCGAFQAERDSTQWKTWEQRLIDGYRAPAKDVAGQSGTATSKEGGNHG